MYYYGQGIEKDYKKSFNLYEGLCERGIYSMCPILSHFYTDGVGMKQDIKKGKEILEKLCYDKYNDGCANLAALYESDQYGMKDEKKNDGTLHYRLQRRSKKSVVRQDRRHEQEAWVFLYRKKRGYSCVELADTYYKNDPEKKLYFYNKACEFGFERACYEIKNTAKQKKI